MSATQSGFHGRIGMIGLGNMGGALAESLLRAGHEVYGFDVDRRKVSDFETSGGVGADSSAEVARCCSVVISCLPTDDALVEAIESERGVQATAWPGLAIIEMSTVRLVTKQRVRSRLLEEGAVLLDCPVSGTARQARLQDLVVFASGDQAECHRNADIFDAIGRRWHYVGEFGMGSKMKLIASMLVAIHSVATAEALVFARTMGLDPVLVHEVIGDSAATSRMFEVAGKIMLEGDYADGASRLDLLYKSLRFLREEALSIDLALPLLSLTTELYTIAMAKGMDELEDAAVCLLFKEWAGIGERPLSDFP